VIQQVVLCSATAFMKCKEILATVQWYSLVTNLAALEQLAQASPDKSYELVKALSETPAGHRVLLTEVPKDMISPFQDSVLKVFFEKSSVVGEFERPAVTTPTNQMPTSRADIHRPVAVQHPPMYRPSNPTGNYSTPRPSNYPTNYNPPTNGNSGPTVTPSVTLESPRMQPLQPVALNESTRIRKDEVYMCYWKCCYHAVKTVAELQQHIHGIHLNTAENCPEGRLTPVKRETADKLQKTRGMPGCSFDFTTTDVTILQQQSQLMNSALLHKEAENWELAGRLRTIMDGTWQALQYYSTKVSESEITAPEDKRKVKMIRKPHSSVVALAGAKTVDTWMKMMGDMAKYESMNYKGDSDVASGASKVGRKKSKPQESSVSLGIIVRNPEVGKRLDPNEAERSTIKPEDTHSRRRGLRTRPGDSSGNLLGTLRSSMKDDVS
jgi:hypothetical protein